MFDEAVPAHFREGLDGAIGSKEVERILSSVAEKDPAAYRDVSFNLLKLGTKGSVETNTSFSLEDLKSPLDKAQVMADMRHKEEGIMNDRSIDRKERDKRLTDLYLGVATSLPEKIFSAAMDKGSNLARMVASGARGNKSQLNSNIGADMLVNDSKGNPVMLPITHNYSEGLTPAEYYAASYGTRLGLISVKACCSGDTEVRMADGTARYIRDIVPGDRIVGSDIEGNPTVVTVLNRFDNGPKPCRRHKFRIYGTDSSVEIVATQDHKVLAKKRGWGKSKKYIVNTPGKFPLREARNNSAGSYAAVPVQGGVDCGTKSEPGALLVGLLLWDGYTPPQKAFPDEVFTWDNSSVANILGGLFSSDGSIVIAKTSVTIKLTLTSLKMLEQTRELLMVRFGIFTRNIRSVDVSRKKWAKNPQWLLGIGHRAALRRFFDKIPLVGKKRLQVERALSFLDDNSSNREDNAFIWAGSDDVGTIETFDLEVDHPDHLYVLANGLVISNSVQDSGYFAKQLSAASSDLLITTKDCKTDQGIATKPDDQANVGALLARPAAGYPAGTVITPKISADLARNLPEGRNIVVRSPLACMARSGICSKCAGIRERGHLPHLSENIGLAAASGVSEPVTQSMLCLAEWTRVRMADDSVKEIKDIQVGDLVLASDRLGNTRSATVLSVYDNGARECWKTEMRTSDERTISLDSTPDHKVLLRSGKVTPIGEEGLDALALQDDESAWAVSHLFLGAIPTFDIEVDHPDHLFVLESGLIVHNSVKHSAGVASAGGGSNVQGFPATNALSQIPRIYPGGAVLSEIDGKVRKIEKAPQGGYSVTVNDWAGHVPLGREVSVKEGDTLEAGDSVSTGVPSPAEIVRLKGVGAGRKYWVDAMIKNLAASGTKIDRRNLEVMARAVVNHVEAGDDVDTARHLPGDILEYGAWQSGYRKARDTTKSKPEEAHGRFLQSPVLHYTIGTRMTPSVSKDLGAAGIDTVETSETEPDFKPHMVRLMDSPAYKDDWATHTGQSYAKRNLKRDIQEGGATSMLHGIHMTIPLARGVEFGRPGLGNIGY